MAPARNNLKIVRGDRLRLQWEVTHLPPGLRIIQAWLTIKASAEDADPGLIQKEINRGERPDIGQIVDDGGDGTATLVFVLLPTETRSLSAGVRYVYDVQVKTNQDDVVTIEYGLVEVVQEVTRQ